MTTPDLPAAASPRHRIPLALLFLAASALSLVLGFISWTDAACPSCKGLLALILPWVGTLFYGFLGALALRNPASPFLSYAAGGYVFVHACLVTEAFVLQRYCWGCFGIAGTAFLAALLQAKVVSAERLTLAVGLLLGAAAGMLSPFDRVEDQVTRRFWPSRILSQAPSFVDQSELSHCSHSSQVRLLVYEDQKSCRACSSVGKRLLPQLAKDFPTEVCIHQHIVQKSRPEQVLPVLVLLSRQTRLVVVEGLPEYESFREMISEMLREIPMSGAEKRN